LVCSVSSGDEGDAKVCKYVIRKFKSRRKVQFLGKRQQISRGSCEFGKQKRREVVLKQMRREVFW
jgi:hypothetical protein